MNIVRFLLYRPKPATLVFAMAISLFFAGKVQAHKVYIFAWLEGDTVYSESYSGGKKVSSGLVEVFGPQGVKLLEGRTDDQGLFSFKTPVRGDLKLVLHASAGHRAEYLLKDSEAGAGGDNKAEAGEAAKDKSDMVRGQSGTVSECLEAEEIKKIVEQALDEKLGPVLRSLAKIREERGPGLTEIIGGIGYILGIMGVAMYFLSRKRVK